MASDARKLTGRLVARTGCPGTGSVADSNQAAGRIGYPGIDLGTDSVAD